MRGKERTRRVKVGKTKPTRLRNRREPFYKTVRSLLGRPYKLGGNGKERSGHIDCFGMIVEYAKLKEKAKKHENYSNYEELFTENPKETILKLSDFLKQNLEQVEKGRIFIGDILICSYEEAEFAAIKAGLSRMIVATEDRGCILVNSDQYEIKEAFRCLP